MRISSQLLYVQGNVQGKWEKKGKKWKNVRFSPFFLRQSRQKSDEKALNFRLIV